MFIVDILAIINQCFFIVCISSQILLDHLLVQTHVYNHAFYKGTTVVVFLMWQYKYVLIMDKLYEYILLSKFGVIEIFFLEIRTI